MQGLLSFKGSVWVGENRAPLQALVLEIARIAADCRGFGRFCSQWAAAWCPATHDRSTTARTSYRSPTDTNLDPSVLRADGPRLEGSVTEEGRGRERDSGARIDQALEGQRRAAGPRAPDACSLTRHRLAPTRQPSVAHRRRRPRRRPRAQNPTTTTPIEAGAGRAGITGAVLRPSARPPRPIRRPKSPQTPSKASPTTLDFLTEMVPGSGR
jgi:hypothetical protein